MKIERIEVPFEVKQVKEDDDFFHIFGLANTWEIDLGRDRSIKGCFLESIKELQGNAQPVMDGEGLMALMPALWQHQSDMPTGVQIELSETDEGLMSHSIYPKSDTFVSGRMIPQVKIGSIRKQSIGYIAEKVTFEIVDDIEIRNLEKVKLKEISLVTFPMNEGAAIERVKTDIKTIHRDEAEKLTERDFEELLTKGSKFTNNASKTIISLIKTGWDAQELEQRDAEEAKRINEKIDNLKKLMRNE